MLIPIICLIIFITYISIIIYLAYVFLKERKIFDTIFSDNFKYITDYIYCPYHELLFGVFIKNNSKYECNLCSLDTINSEIYLEQLEILSSIYKLFKLLDKYILQKYDNKYRNKYQNKYEMLIWLLEGSIRDYENIKDEHLEIYNQIKAIYTNTIYTNTNYQIEFTNPKKDCNLDANNNLDENNNLEEIENHFYLEETINKLNDIIKLIEKNKTKISNFNSLFLIALILDLETFSSSLKDFFNKLII